MGKRKFYLILLLVFSLLGCQSNSLNLKTGENENEELYEKRVELTRTKESEEIEEEEEEPEEPEEPEEIIETARLKFLGDILPHLNIHLHAEKAGNGEYNYDKNFELIKDFTNDSDLTIGNNEFTIHPEKEPSGYPQFVAPDTIYDTLKDSGFDILTTANNHSLDSYVEGVYHTLEALENKGIDAVGTQKEGESPYLMKEVNGIQIGILAYTESLNGLDGVLDTPEKKTLVNRLDAEQIEEDISKILEEGAEFVIVYPHWGVEYSSYPEERHIDLARNMIDWGADVVIGNHPHVVQPKEIIESEDGRMGVIYYSVGNFISDQCLETMNGDQRTEQGLIVEVEIEKSSLEDRAKIINETYHPTWMGRRYTDDGILHRVHIVDEFINNGPKSDQATEQELNRMIQAKEMTTKTVETVIE